MDEYLCVRENHDMINCLCHILSWTMSVKYGWRKCMLLSNTSVQFLINIWCMFGTKPLYQPMLDCYQVGPNDPYFSEISFDIEAFLVNNMHRKMPFAKWRPCCPCRNGLTGSVRMLKFDGGSSKNEMLFVWFIVCVIASGAIIWPQERWVDSKV